MREKEVWQCPNCGKTMAPYLSLKHYSFCAMARPPQNQPGRGDELSEELERQEAEKFKQKWWQD